MTWSAKRDEVFKDVSYILVFIVASRVDVVNVKATTTRTVFHPTSLAYLVAFVDKGSDVLPIPTVLEARAAAPVGTVFSDHVVNAASSRTEAPTTLNLARERWENLAAVFAGMYGVLSCSSMLALSGAVLGARMNGRFATDGTWAGFCVLLFVCHVTVTGTEDRRGTFPRSVGLSLELCSTVAANKRLRFSDGVDSTLFRTVPNHLPVSLELVATLETSLEHH